MPLLAGRIDHALRNRSNPEGHGQRKRDNPHGHAGNQIMGQTTGSVTFAKTNDGFRQIPRHGSSLKSSAGPQWPTKSPHGPTGAKTVAHSSHLRAVVNSARFIATIASPQT